MGNYVRFPITTVEGDLGSNPNVQEFHYKRNPDD